MTDDIGHSTRTASPGHHALRRSIRSAGRGGVPPIWTKGLIQDYRRIAPAHYEQNGSEWQDANKLRLEERVNLASKAQARA